MDEKKWYKLVFKQLQPIHIGSGSYRVINETRIFIPGWAMWGALTKAYNIQFNNKLSENQELFEEISCFYPCFDENGVNTLLPSFKNGEFYLGDCSESEFRAKFVDTFISTAIVPCSRMAKDESLHEINVILPGAKSDFIEDEKEKQLYWVGILNIEEDKKIEFLKENKLAITAGGDSRYGLGEMELIKIEEISEESNDFQDLFKSNYIPIQNKLNAEIELVVETIGYEGKTLKIQNQKYCYMPGHGVTSVKLTKGVLYAQ